MCKPLVSVIMGAYNCEDTIRDCIDSIIIQSYRAWEFIICDDSSKDHTLDILREYEKNDSRIHVLTNEANMRLAASLNRCLSEAHGKYVARMDADDISMPNRLERQVAFLEANTDYDVVGCDRIIFDENGDLGVRKSIEYPDKSVLLKNPPFAHPTIMMKKSVYDALGGYTVSEETMRAEDLDLWFRFYEHGFKGYNIQEALYKYRESKTDYQKRSLKAGIMTAKVFWSGYQKIDIPCYKRIWAIKPILSAIIPNTVMMNYHKNELS